LISIHYVIPCAIGWVVGWVEAECISVRRMFVIEYLLRTPYTNHFCPNHFCLLGTPETVGCSFPMHKWLV
jgi:hypothetical protein